jgi:ArsR family transcriptional regulator, arsenate/arsenite/antimonite-responsive transcriptional repressor
METDRAVGALGALAQSTRLAIFRLLVTVGPDGLAAGVIGERLGLPPATLSFHLKELGHAGLVEARPSGRYVIYSADFAAITGLIDFLTENCCGGRSCAPGDAPQAAPLRRAVR